MKITSSFVFLLLSAAAVTCAAQAPAGLKYTAGRIVFVNPGHYGQAQLEAVEGIHPGMKLTADDLGNAAQHLVDSGFFADVGATLQGDINHVDVLFKLQPTDRAQMLRVGFENFVWLSRSEIETALTAKSPLFPGYLPESSPLADTFDAALTDALAAKGVTAKVTHDTVEPTLQRPERIIEFRIDSPPVQVVDVKLAGVPADLAPLIQKSVNLAAKAPFNEGLAGQTTQNRILTPLFDAGYIQATLSDVKITPTLAAGAATVVLSATLNTGDIYHVSSINFAGAPLLSPDAFAVTEKLHAGDIASRTLLLQTLAPLDAAYRRQGYMDVIVEAAPALDSTTHQVAYTVSVNPGEPYRLNQVTTNGLDPDAQADFDRGFQMKKGDVFNPEYVLGFFAKNPDLKALIPYGGNYKAYANPNTHTVDVVLTFARGGAKLVNTQQINVTPK